ncbi:MAG: hypothetical protein J6K32_01865 [Clostridia bacterium]|nr:hypothetical protein [Clostridia bacterium]
MDMRAMHDLREMLCKELDKIAAKGELTAGGLETVHKLTDTIKNIDKILMLEDDEDYSERRDSMGRYSRNDGYERGSSYARRGTHYVRGHYSRDDGMGGSMRETRGRYSRAEGKDQMLHELGEMMEDADDEQRRILERAMQEIRKA